MPVLVKICGITSVEDASVAVEAGADALGFIFYRKSPRYVSPDAAAEIIRQLPAAVSKIGVFVDESPELVNKIVAQAGLTRVQLHGSEPMETCSSIGVPVIKAFRIKDQGSLTELSGYPVSALLLDSYVAGQPGGTGEKFNWDLAVQAKRFGLPIFLAGGLTAENVADAVAKVAPYAVDVSSGVEATPGRKDHALVREFIRRAKAG